MLLPLFRIKLRHFLYVARRYRWLVCLFADKLSPFHAAISQAELFTPIQKMSNLFLAWSKQPPRTCTTASRFLLLFHSKDGYIGCHFESCPDREWALGQAHKSQLARLAKREYERWYIACKQEGMTVSMQLRMFWSICSLVNRSQFSSTASRWNKHLRSSISTSNCTLAARFRQLWTFCKA